MIFSIEKLLFKHKLKWNISANQRCRFT